MPPFTAYPPRPPTCSTVPALHNSGLQRLQLEWIPIVQRQGFDRLCFDDLAQRPADGIHLRDIRLHENLLRHRPSWSAMSSDARWFS
jgi:hypothetical protein